VCDVRQTLLAIEENETQSNKLRFCTSHWNLFMQYKPTKCIFPKLISFSIFGRLLHVSNLKVHLVNKTNVKHNLSCMFISMLYMFRATMCPSSGETTVSVRHLVFVTLYGWPSGMKGDPAGWDPARYYPAGSPWIPDGYIHRVTNTRCRIDTVVSPDDGHIVARNM
jgi:hypothetical protein